MDRILDFLASDKLKKYVPALRFVLLGIIAFAASYVINTEIIAPLLDLPKEAKKDSRPSPTVKIRESRARDFYNIVIDRNIFDSTDQPVPGGIIASGDPNSIDMSGPAIPSSLPIKLIGTMVLDNPKWSIALITGGSRKNSNVYKINDIVLSSAMLAKIERNKVFLKNNGRLEFIEIKEKEQSFTAESKPGDVGVNKVSDDKYVINRRELDQAFSDLATILTQARVVPHFENGKPNGFRIFAIQAGSIYSKIGLKNHDIIHRVNGNLIDDPTKGLQLFNSLKSENKIELDIIRGGVKSTIRYDIK